MNVIKDKNYRDEIKIKLQFYLISLWLLFFIIFLLNIDFSLLDKNAKLLGIVPFLKGNWLALGSLLLVLFSRISAALIEWKWSGVANPGYKIETIKNENYEYLTFLTTYIIPLISIELTTVRYVVVLVVLLIIIGYIFVNMDLYYGNPTLALLGYRLYKAKLKGSSSPGEVVLISKDRLHVGSVIKWIKVDAYVYVAKEIKK